jgi:excisionase family DNA binding protein
VLTVKEAAKRLGVSASLVYALCAAGEIAHSRHGRPGRRGKVVISEEAVVAYQTACRRDGGRTEPAPIPLRHLSV